MRPRWLALAILLILGTAQGLPGGMQDDAGTGRDAPDGPTPDIVLLPGIVYQGRLQGADQRDWYAFDVRAGDYIEVHAAGLGCFDLARPDGRITASDCAYDLTGRIGRIRFDADTTGTWFVQYQGAGLDDYRFSVGLNGPAPEPLPAWSALADTGGIHQNDAGSGRDAPSTPWPEFRITTGQTYEGMLGGDSVADIYDHYAFDASAGQTIRAASSGLDHCLRLLDSQGSVVASACSRATVINGSISHTATATETHYLLIQYDTPLATPDTYRFGVALDHEVVL